MTIGMFFGRLSSRKAQMIMIAACLLLTFIFLKWKGMFLETVKQLQADYRIDLDLYHHKEEHVRSYESILNSAQLPKGETLAPNAWIQSTQSVIADQKLSLQELKPVYQVRKKMGKKTGLFLVVEGRVANLLGFLYQIAKSDDFVYVDELTVSPATERSDLVRAQMTLYQLERK